MVLVVGLLRVFYFDKGAAYFLSWRKPLQQGQLPVMADRRLRTVRSILHWELAAIVVLILCAALMARGGRHVLIPGENVVRP